MSYMYNEKASIRAKARKNSPVVIRLVISANIKAVALRCRREYPIITPNRAGNFNVLKNDSYRAQLAVAAGWRATFDRL